MKKYLYLLLVLFLFVGCKSSKHALSPDVKQVPHYLSSKMQLVVPNGSGNMSVGGTMKIKTNEHIQLSVLMPVLRSELFRLDVTPTEVLLIDRMNKRYIKTTPAQLAKVSGRNVRFADLQKLIVEAASGTKGGELTGKDFGLSSFENAKVKLYDFSEKEVELTPAAIPNRYTQITLDELVKSLTE